MTHCSIHGLDYSSADCPRCLTDERHRELLEQAERQHEQSLEAAVALVRANASLAKRAEHLRANPGDYECPHCRYVSLKRDASRCPTCHGTIDPSYWQLVTAKERAEAKADAERAAREAQAWRTSVENLSEAESARRSTVDSRRQSLKSAYFALFAFIIGGLYFGHSSFADSLPWWSVSVLWLVLGIFFMRLGRQIEEWRDHNHLWTYLGLASGGLCWLAAAVTLVTRWLRYG